MLGVFFSSDKFCFLTSHFWRNFFITFKRFCCPELKFDYIFHLWSFFVRLLWFKNCYFVQFGTINERYISLVHIQNSPKDRVIKNSMKEQTVRLKFAGSKFRIRSYPLWQARNTLARLRWSLICSFCLMNKGQLSAHRLVKLIITWDCFSDCFVTVFFVYFHTFRTVLYWTVCMGLFCTDTISRYQRVSGESIHLRNRSKL